MVKNMIFKSCPFCQSTDIKMPDNRFLSCQSCHRTYYHNAASAVAGIIQVDNQILLNVRKKQPGAGLFDLVGGFVDFDESMEQALIRETYEELGITTEDWQYVCSFPNTYEYDNIKYYTVDAVFAIQLAQQPSIKIQASELLDAQWFHIDNIPYEQFAFDSLKFALQQYIRQL